MDETNVSKPPSYANLDKTTGECFGLMRDEDNSPPPVYAEVLFNRAASEQFSLLHIPTLSWRQVNEDISREQHNNPDRSVFSSLKKIIDYKLPLALAFYRIYHFVVVLALFLLAYFSPDLQCLTSVASLSDQLAELNAFSKVSILAILLNVLLTIIYS